MVNSTNEMHDKVEKLIARVDESKLDFHTKRLFSGEISGEEILEKAKGIGDQISYKAWALVKAFPFEADALIRNSKHP